MFGKFKKRGGMNGVRSCIEMGQNLTIFNTANMSNRSPTAVEPFL